MRAGLRRWAETRVISEHIVKFGVFYEHQLPRPWSETSEQELVSDALDQIELADRLGVQYLWEVEHHFLEEYSHSIAPEVFLAAASQRTRRMRIGHGVVQAAPAYNHPARTAERLAMLDLVSEGRVEFGSGESSSEAELAGFGVDRDTKRDAWLEGLEVGVRCMTETPFGGVHGRFVSMPPRNLVPKPVQKPHPPLWVACSRRHTILLAARKGIGALSFAFVEPEDAGQWVVDYERVLGEQCVPVGLLVNPRVACVTPMMCAPREEDAPARRHETLGAKAAAGDTTGLRGTIGTPAQLREFLRRYEEAGVDQLIFVMQAGKHRHEHIMESLELFGTQVLPEFVERDEAASEAKAAKWAPLIEAALARRDRTDPVMPPDYVMRAIPKQMVEATANEPAQQWLESPADKQAAGVLDEEFRRLVDG
jgi:alkanesulfonate monooxygenase SsuD/methylene tetrahydromethanopterin reductase-like flavin-dependent oxidoreductase (luciferase family)